MGWETRSVGDGVKPVASDSPDMKRYETEIRNGVLYIEGNDGWLETGSMDVIFEIIGDDTYTIEYDEQQRQMDWLNTDEEGKFTFDIHETIESMSYDSEFVANIASVDPNETDENGYPLRASVFADLMTSIWDSKGNV